MRESLEIFRELQRESHSICGRVCGHTVRSVSLNLSGKLKSFKWQRELILQDDMHYIGRVHSFRILKNHQGVVVNNPNVKY